MNISEITNLKKPFDQWEAMLSVCEERFEFTIICKMAEEADSFLECKLAYTEITDNNTGDHKNESIREDYQTNLIKKMKEKAETIDEWLYIHYEFVGAFYNKGSIDIDQWIISFKEMNDNIKESLKEI